MTATRLVHACATHCYEIAFALKHFRISCSPQCASASCSRPKPLDISVENSDNKIKQSVASALSFHNFSHLQRFLVQVNGHRISYRLRFVRNEMNRIRYPIMDSADIPMPGRPVIPAPAQAQMHMVIPPFT